MTEAQHQEAVIDFARHPVILRQWPELALLYHIPNGGKRSQSEAAHFKRLGVLPGVADLHLPVARGEYHSLYIELKAEKGKLSDHQKWFGEQVSKAGNLWAVCYGAYQAIDLLQWYIKGASEKDCPVAHYTKG